VQPGGISIRKNGLNSLQLGILWELH
jgi:hypothetical protein